MVAKISDFIELKLRLSYNEKLTQAGGKKYYNKLSEQQKYNISHKPIMTNEQFNYLVRQLGLNSYLNQNENEEDIIEQENDFIRDVIDIILQQSIGSRYNEKLKQMLVFYLYNKGLVQNLFKAYYEKYE